MTPAIIVAHAIRLFRTLQTPPVGITPIVAPAALIARLIVSFTFLSISSALVLSIAQSRLPRATAVVEKLFLQAVVLTAILDTAMLNLKCRVATLLLLQSWMEVFPAISGSIDVSLLLHRLGTLPRPIEKGSPINRVLLLPLHYWALPQQLSKVQLVLL